MTQPSPCATASASTLENPCKLTGFMEDPASVGAPPHGLPALDNAASSDTTDVGRPDRRLSLAPRAPARVARPPKPRSRAAARASPGPQPRDRPRDPPYQRHG